LQYLFYVRLIALTAGTLVYLFLLALILGHRRPRFFERLLFFVVLSLFLLYAGGLLGINAAMQYGAPPEATKELATALAILGSLFLTPLVWHTFVLYRKEIRNSELKWWYSIPIYVLYATGLFEIGAIGLFLSARDLAPLRIEVLNYFIATLRGRWLLTAFILSMCLFDIVRTSKDRNERNLFRWMLFGSALLVATLGATFSPVSLSSTQPEMLTAATIVLGVVPGALLIYFSLRKNFLEFGAQRNLVYALSAMFLALLYLALVRRISGWLEPTLPPEATASILLFVLIFLFEPLERVIGPALHRAHQQRFGRVQKLAVELQQQARNGNVASLLVFAERRIREEFGLAVVRLVVPRDPALAPLESPGGLGHVTRLPLMKDGDEIGLLEAATTGSYLTGETSAALEFLAEQLPASIDLCRLIEDKVQLERELAERERLAVLGQMAANVSHNLRNPLSSMKTVIQVQLENPDLPIDARRDCILVVSEIDRMSAKLTQLLRYAKPSVNGERVGAVALARQTASLFGRDAERRSIRLEFDQPREEISVLASEEALGEVLSNLIVNAMEAQPDGGRVRVALSRNGDDVEIRVEDDGPGISDELRGKIFQPYFTTKTTGTGLGLSIVARRVAEMGGTVSCESPLRNGTGTRFRLTLPLAKENGG
jgi:signal transduction histidine kinase